MTLLNYQSLEKQPYRVTRHRLLLPALLLVLPAFALLFLLPEKPDNISYFENELLFSAAVSFLLLAAIGLLLILPHSITIRVNQFDKLVLVFFSWLFVNEGIRDPLFFIRADHYTHEVLLAGVLYMLIRFDKEKALEQVCIRYVFPLVWYTVIGYGLIELLRNLSANGHFHFDLFFTNTGKAGVFILLAGMINFKYLQKSIVSGGRTATILASTSILVALVLLAVSGSRTAWISGLLVTTAYLVTTTKLINKKTVLVILITCLVAIVATITLFYKPDSGWGRVLIWKVSLQNIPHYLLYGEGLDKFGAVYNTWQSNYFSSTLPAMNRETYLADNTFFAFNDYLQFAVELGAIPLVLLTGWFVSRLWAGRKHIKTEYKLFLLATGISACTFYTLHLPAMQLLFVIVIGFISNASHATSKQYSTQPRFKFLLLIPACFVFKVLITSNSLLKGVPYWKQARADIEFNEVEALDEYRTAAGYLEGEGEFMIEYAWFLSTLKKFRESIVATAISQKHRTYQSTFLNYGYCYESLGKTALAESWYKKAIACIPSRLGSRYKLILLYNRLNRKDKVQIESQQALALTLKNPDDALSRELQQAIKQIYVAYSTNYKR